jgi:DNA invertase Pin-like site-specific DNA recombinase
MTTSETKIAMVGYTRVSTNGQADNGHSLPAQRAAIQSAADQRGWEIIWANDAASGKSMERPGMAYALSLLKSGAAQGIVASKLDRISRSVLDFANLLEQAQREEWNIVLLDNGLDLSTPYGRLAVGILMQFAQFEREMISARTKDALAAAKKEKGIVPGPKSKVPAEVIARIRELFVDGGMTMAETANALTQDRVPLPSGREGVWQPAQVARVLARATPRIPPYRG